MQLFAQKGERNIPAHAGKRVEADDMLYAIRNIPAHAGKTCVFVCAGEGLKEHPRARGENRHRDDLHVFEVGTSPRTRGKRAGNKNWAISPRNIPAHAGKTRIPHPTQISIAEHPRARGENLLGLGDSFCNTGTSPRTRGKHTAGSFLRWRERNIPAHAGKTPTKKAHPLSQREHPRARGEN